MTPDERYIEVRSPNDLRVKRTRVGVEHLLSLYLAGSLPEEIAIEFPTVTLEQVHGVIAWYLGNRDEADAYLGRWRHRAESLRSEAATQDQSAVIQRLRRLAQEHVTG